MKSWIKTKALLEMARARLKCTILCMFLGPESDKLLVCRPQQQIYHLPLSCRYRSQSQAVNLGLTGFIASNLKGTSNQLTL